MSRTCARVLAAALMTGGIAAALALPALVGDAPNRPRALVAPPSSLQRVVRIQAGAATERPGTKDANGRLSTDRRSPFLASVVRQRTVGQHPGGRIRPERPAATPVATPVAAPAPAQPVSQPTVTPVAAPAQASGPAVAEPPRELASAGDHGTDESSGSDSAKGKRHDKQKAKNEAAHSAPAEAESQAAPPPPAAPVPAAQAPESAGDGDDADASHDNGKGNDKEHGNGHGKRP